MTMESVMIKPSWRGWMHLVSFEISLVIGTLLLVAADGPRQITATAIYVGSVAGLFGASALYHRGNWSLAVRRILQRVDHFMIFVMIAGTATPVFMLAVGGELGWFYLAVMWTLTLIGSSIHQIWMHAPNWVAVCVYSGLGLVSVMALPSMSRHGGAEVITLIVAGGVLYLAGAVALNRQWPDPHPATFGYHEVFHAYVCAAATCHYVAIALLVLNGVGR